MSVSCRQVVVNEKLVDLPQHQWRKNLKAVVRYTISDSTNHQLYFIVRHTQQFLYNKLLVKLDIEDSVKQPLTSMNINIPLTDSAGNWSGEVMGDIYYRRVHIQPPVFLKPGIYRFVMQHQMKDTVLPYILNVGIALTTDLYIHLCLI